jgi:drug/metabolite transporter (DMT)-like permease
VPTLSFLELLLLSAIWGASFLFMRNTSADFGPIMLITLRTGIAALVLIPFVMYKKQWHIMARNWLPILLVALTNTAIPFCLFSYSTLYLGAGYASVLNASAPMFAAIVGFYWLKDNLSIVAVIGLIVGFFGVLLLSLARQNTDFETSLLPILAALCATLLYGVAACLTKRYLQGVNPLAIATGSQCFAVLVLAPLSLFFWPAAMPGIQSWWQVLALGVFCTALAYILYFRLIANVGAAKAITVAYLVPVFGVIWGMTFLDEHLTPGMWFGAALVLLGVALTTGLIKRRIPAPIG